MDQGSQNINRGGDSSEGGGSQKSDTVTAPSIFLLEGGWAIKGMGEKFAANPVTSMGFMSMPYIIEGDPNPPVKIRPRSALLRYDLHEEEVPRAGIQVTQSFQRTRWYNGGVFVWLGVRKRTGRCERSSGLRFD